MPPAPSPRSRRPSPRLVQRPHRPATARVVPTGAVAVLAVLALVGLAARLTGPGRAAAAGKTTLVLGVDISDARTFDPARQFEYSSPIVMKAAYDTLVTVDPGDYGTLKPLLAESWKLVDGGKAW